MDEANEEFNLFINRVYELVHSGYNFYNHLHHIPHDEPVTVDNIDVSTRIITKGRNNGQNGHCPVFLR